MPYFRFFPYFFLFFLLLTGCRKVFFEAEPDNTPEAIFENCWQTFQEQYAPFEERGVDWDATYTQFRPEVTANSSEASLYNTLTRMLATLNDGHVNLMAPGRPVFRSNRYFNARIDDSLFNLKTVKTQYLSKGFTSGEDDAYTYGLLDGNIAYVHFKYVSDNWNVLPDLLERYRDAKGLIVDLRHNDGGDFTYAFVNMGRLTDQKRLVFTSQTKNGPSKADYTETHTWFLEKKGVFWDKKIAVLIDRYTISAGERAAMAFKTLPQVTMFGDTTNGAHSTMMGRELANGWHYSIATQKVWLYDGKSYEGIGIAPNVIVRNTLAELEQGKDAVLDKAIATLK